MVGRFAAGLINKNTSRVIDQFLSNTNLAGDGPPVINFVHHVQLANHGSVLSNCIDFGSLLSPATFQRRAVLALDLSGTPYSIAVPICLVGRACFICNIIVSNPLIRLFWIPSMASSRYSVTGNEDLGWEVNIRPGSFSLNFDAVW